MNAYAKKITVGVAGVTILFVVVFYFWSKGSVVTVLPPANSQVKGVAVAEDDSKVLKNTYVQAVIPARFILRTHTEGKGMPTFLQQLYTVPVSSKTTIASDQLAVTVSTLPNTGLQEVSDVQLRLRGNTIYKQIALPVTTTNDMIIFESEEQGYELSAFVSNDDKLGAFVMTAQTQGKESVKKEMQSLLQTLVWL